jgi:hypothetical protein
VAEQGLSDVRQGLGAATIEAGGTRLRDYLEALDERAERAAVAVGGFVDLDYLVAGQTLRLRFAGPALIPRLTPSLAHLRTPVARKPDLSVRLFDSRSTGTEPPDPPWGPEAYDRNGRVHASLGGRLSGIFDSGTLSLHDPASDRGLYWTEDAGDVRASETGSPLIRILDLWLGARAVQVTHAAAVGDAHGCVLIVGPGGAGKTSTALACLDSSLRIAGDDYCLLLPGQEPRVHTLYSAAKVDAHAQARLPGLARMVENPARPPDDKGLIYLHERAPDKLLREAPLRAIAIPHVTGARDTHTAPATASEALGALAPSTLLQLVGRDRSALARLAHAVRAVPCHRLELGTEVAQVPEALGKLLGW